jgi:hypothetical protein
MLWFFIVAIIVCAVSMFVSAGVNKHGWVLFFGLLGMTLYGLAKILLNYGII